MYEGVFKMAISDVQPTVTVARLKIETLFDWCFRKKKSSALHAVFFFGTVDSYLNERN